MKLAEMAAPRAPRGGHWMIVGKHPEGGVLAKRINSVSKGYAYVDTDGPMRDAIHVMDLEYVGHGGKGHMWKERGM